MSNGHLILGAFPQMHTPTKVFCDLHCDQDWSYLDLMSPCWIYTVIKTWHPPIQVLLLRQAFATKGPGMRHSYFCFWQNPRYPLGEVADATFHGGSNVHHQGHNHASATLAIAHAKFLAGWESEPFKFDWSASPLAIPHQLAEEDLLYTVAITFCVQNTYPDEEEPLPKLQCTISPTDPDEEEPLHSHHECHEDQQCSSSSAQSVPAPSAADAWEAPAHAPAPV